MAYPYLQDIHSWFVYVYKSGSQLIMQGRWEVGKVLRAQPASAGPYGEGADDVKYQTAI